MSEWIAGLETGNGVEFDSFSGSIDSVTKRTGGYSCKNGLADSGVGALDASEVVLRWYFRYSSHPSQDAEIGRIGDNSPTARVYLWITPDGKLKVDIVGGSTDTGGTTVPTGSFNLLELRYKAGSGANAEAEIRLEESSEASVSDGDGITNASYFSVRRGHTSFDDSWFDDIRFTTVVWPGPGQIEALRPDAVGDADTNYSGSWADIDNDPVDEATYRECSAATGDFFDGIADVPEDFDSVNVVSVGVWTKGGSSGNEQYIRYKNSGGGAQEALIPDLPRQAFAYRTFIPGTQPTTAADINGGQIGMRHNDSKTGTVAEMWLMVDYTPAGEPPPSGVIRDVIGYGIIPFAR